MDERLSPNAPRFHALLERSEGRSIFMLSRTTWDSLRLQAGSLVLLDTGQLAESPVAAAPSFVIGAAAQTDERVRLEIYRLDFSDDPDLINVDTYDVWERLPPRIDVPFMIAAASTSANENFQRYLENHVFLVKRSPGFGHHRPDVPEEVLIRLRFLGKDAV